MFLVYKLAAAPQSLYRSGKSPPFLYQQLHILRNRAVEVHLLSRARVYKPERLGMEGLAWTYLKTIVNELHILARVVATQHHVAAIPGIVEQRVTDMLHVHAYLVCAPGFELAPHHRHMRQVFERVEVRHRMFVSLSMRCTSPIRGSLTS